MTSEERITRLEEIVAILLGVLHQKGCVGEALDEKRHELLADLFADCDMDQLVTFGAEKGGG